MELLLVCKMTEMSWLATPHFVVATFSIPHDHDHESAVCRRGNDVDCRRACTRRSAKAHGAWQPQ
jgi:hypothetical protein